MTDGTLIGYTVKEFRKRIGADGINELIKLRKVAID